LNLWGIAVHSNFQVSRVQNLHSCKFFCDWWCIATVDVNWQPHKL